MTLGRGGQEKRLRVMRKAIVEGIKGWEYGGQAAKEVRQVKHVYALTTWCTAQNPGSHNLFSSSYNAIFPTIRYLMAHSCQDVHKRSHPSKGKIP